MNTIFSHFISQNDEGDIKRVGYILWFSDTFPDSEFSGEDLIMKRYVDYSARLEVPLKYQYFNVFLSTELKRILIETNVRVAGTDNLNYSEPVGLETAYNVVREYLLEQFKVLESYETSVDDFKVDVDAFMTTRLTERAVEELGRTYDTLSNTENSRDAVEYALDNLIFLRDIYDRSSLDEIDTVRKSNKDAFVFVADTGIPVIDNDIGGIYTSQVIGVEAQPGTGKTRFALGVWVYRAAVLYKKNVIYYQLEQSEVEARAILIARHVFTLYGIQISDAMILRGEVPDDLTAKVKAAELDLFESGKYGKIFIYRIDLYVETLTQTFRKMDKLHGPFDMLAIDYMGLLMQRPGKYQKEKSDYQVINDGFRKFKNYVERTRKCGIAVSQFNKEGINAGKADKEITTDMSQGGIAVYRHTDQNLALSCTTVMKAQQKLRVSQPKIRGTAGFGTAVIDTRLAFAYFYQNNIAQI